MSYTVGININSERHKSTMKPQYTETRGSYRIEIISNTYQKLYKNDKLVKAYTQKKSALDTFNRLASKEQYGIK